MEAPKQELYDPNKRSDFSIPIVNEESGHHFRANVIIVLGIFTVVILLLAGGLILIRGTKNQSKKVVATSPSPSPRPSCKPRPACLDQEPKCLIMETSDMCSPAPTVEPSPSGTVCTMEAKLCPDGINYVGRQGPNCDFAACPGEHCGGFIQNAPVCGTGYHCQLNQQIPDTGGTCIKD